MHEYSDLLGIIKRTFSNRTFSQSRGQTQMCLNEPVGLSSSACSKPGSPSAKMMSSWILLVALACGLAGAQDPTLQELSTKVQQLTTKVEELQRDVSVRQVAFSAALLETQEWTDVGPFDADKTLEFKKVVTNVGNGYNPETGIFTAPVKGLYYFRVTGMAGSSGELNAGLKKNGQNMFAIYQKAGTQAGTSNGMALELEQGDRVYVQLWPNLTVADQSRLSTFTGFLVFPM
uniref:C1q domain-containing protein n=2 Tax=Oryzias melastigma TaxID=30732 RepID=A0A3B3C539_ORYME